MNALKQARINASKNMPALLTLTTLLVACIVIIESIRKQDLIWGPLHDSSHSFVFFLVSLIGYLLFSLRTSQRGLRIALVAGGCFLTGIAIELVQPFVGRSASFNDIYYNFIGISSGALLFLALTSKDQGKRKITLGLTSILLLGSSLTVPGIGYYTYMKRDTLMPELLNFEEPWQRRLWRAGGGAHASVVDAPSEWQQGSKVVRIDYPKRSYPGLTIKHVSPDWSDYQTLSFSVFSKLETPQQLTLRVNDRAHIHQYSDRFNQRIVVHPGLNQIQIGLDTIMKAPKDREMNIDSIAELAIFAVKPSTTFTLYFDDFRLEK